MWLNVFVYCITYVTVPTEIFKILVTYLMGAVTVPFFFDYCYIHIPFWRVTLAYLIKDLQYSENWCTSHVLFFTSKRTWLSSPLLHILVPSLQVTPNLCVLVYLNFTDSAKLQEDSHEPWEYEWFLCINLLKFLGQKMYTTYKHTNDY